LSRFSSRDVIRYEMNMKSQKCCRPGCTRRAHKNVRGRPNLYCSNACRQKVYRTRRGNLHLRLLKQDLATIADQTGRGRAAVAVLQRLGYKVTLERSQRMAHARAVEDQQEKERVRDRLRVVAPERST